MKRAVRAGLFFALLSGGAVFLFLLALAGSGFRILTLAAFPAGFTCALVTFFLSHRRFPVLAGMLSGALALLALPFVTYLIGLLLEGELPFRSVPQVALLLSVPLLSGHGSSLTVLGAVFGGLFARFWLVRERPVPGHRAP